MIVYKLLVFIVFVFFFFSTVKHVHFSLILCLAHLRADLTPALVCVMQPLAGHPR